jgi:pyruvate dehydrogenase E1 component alpha subunit
VETSKSELWQMLTTMTRMRRLELSADQLYKTKLARGFLHLADGQEAIPAGMEAGATFKDSMIQSYRDHLTYLGRGGTVKQVAAELMGRYSGASKGIGGSMHLYFREHNFFGGSGIVGEQVPIGAGLAFAHKYRKDGSVSFTIYGDGAANQGQIFEAFNIASLWDLPCVFVVENNHYGMGTAEARAAKSPKYFTRGDYMPGMWVDGMDVLAVKNAVQFAKQYALDKGPLILEMDTYRYHGHSISDPGSTYRTRDEIQGIRKSRDPIEHVKTLLQEHGWAEATELKKHDKEVRAQVNAEIEEAKKGEFPPTEFLWKNTYKDGLGSKMRPMEIGQEKIPV